MSDKLTDWLFGVIARPAQTLYEISREKPVGLALLVYSVVAFLNFAISFLGDRFDEVLISELGINIPLPVILITVIFFTLLSLFIATALLNLMARLFGGQGGYWHFFSAYAFAGFPLLIGVPVHFVAGFLGIFGSILSGVTSFGLAIWVLILQVIAIRESHSLTTGMSILAYFVYLIILVVISVALVLTAGMVFYAM